MINKQKIFSVITLGCKVNSYESEAIINNLVEHGFIYQEELNSNCDLVVINTCTVTQTSDQKSRQMINQARRLTKADNESEEDKTVIIAVGCFVQLNITKALELADIVIGTNNKLDVYDKYIEFINSRKKINAVSDVLTSPCYEEMKVSRMVTHTRAFIKIQDGCENYCSYCAIPYSRGKIRSRNPINIINEIKALIDIGIKEVILAGINTGAYGRDFNNEMTLAKLIDMILTETNLYRLRISSIELKEISNDFLEVICKHSSRIAHHFHIPMQAGSDTVLKRMNRKYLTNDFIQMVERIRTLFPDAAITTDCLAGFVGETVDEFNELLAFIDRIKFYEMHIFPYSKRLGTQACEMEGHLDERLKKERARYLIEYQKKYTDEFILSRLGNTYEIICEDMKDGYYHGHTSNYLDIYFSSNKNLLGQIVKVKILSYNNIIKNNKIIGEIVNE